MMNYILLLSGNDCYTAIEHGQIVSFPIYLWNITVYQYVYQRVIFTLVLAGNQQYIVYSFIDIHGRSRYIIQRT